APAFSPTVSPSKAVEGAMTTPHRSQAGGDNRMAMARGTLVHRLLQALPDIPTERRADAAREHLKRAGAEFTTDDHEQILGEVLSVLADPSFAPLFIAGSRAEVPIVGRIIRPGRRPFMVSGQIDRLAVTETEVLVADYKTNRPAPRRVEDVPQVY